EDHQVDVGIAQAQFGQAVEQHMAAFLYAIALLHLRAEEGADTGFDEDIAPRLLDQQGATAQVDAVVLVGGHPALPEYLGGIAEHGAAVEFLAVAGKAGESTHVSILAGVAVAAEG